MNSIFEASWQPTEYSAPVEETISLVGKCEEMLGTTLRDFAPQIVGVGQMKLEAPLQYSGKRHPVARV